MSGIMIENCHDVTDEPEVQVMRVIRTTLTRAGTGRDEDSPLRRVTQYWSFDGQLLAEVDDFAPKHCNAIGHIVMPGKTECSRCAAKIK